MIAFVDRPPTVEPHGDSFLVTIRSGETETAFMLTLHALTGLASIGGLRVKEAQALMFESTPFQLRQQAKPEPSLKGREADA